MLKSTPQHSYTISLRFWTRLNTFEVVNKYLWADDLNDSIRSIYDIFPYIDLGISKITLFLFSKAIHLQKPLAFQHYKKKKWESWFSKVRTQAASDLFSSFYLKHSHSSQMSSKQFCTVNTADTRCFMKVVTLISYKALRPFSTPMFDHTHKSHLLHLIINKQQ